MSPARQLAARVQTPKTPPPFTFLPQARSQVPAAAPAGAAKSSRARIEVIMTPSHASATRRPVRRGGVPLGDRRPNSALSPVQPSPRSTPTLSARCPTSSAPPRATGELSYSPNGLSGGDGLGLGGLTGVFGLV